MKLWGGRFTRETDSQVEAFNASIAFDSRLYRHDIQGSQAHARALVGAGLITPAEAQTLIQGLAEVLADLEQGRAELTVEAEDIHMNVEKLLTEKVGEVGKKLHTARSRNDQVALDLRLYVRDEIDQVAALLKNLCSTLLDLADAHRETIMPGYTHLQKAQPITLAHHFLAYVQMFLRDLDRLKDCRRRMNYSPLGSGALAGTTFPLDRQAVARELGFDGITLNSLDGVSDRDYLVEFVNCLSLVMVHLSRFAEEVILWNTDEWRFIELDDAFATGSSIMPQKKNPDVAELVRGKAGRVFGHLMALLTVLKGLPLAYNKDLQEDKEAVFDAIDTVKACLTVFTPMLATASFNIARLREGAAGGFTNATDAADYLVKKGLPFRDAHAVVGRAVQICLAEGLTLEELPLKRWQELCSLADEEIFEAISLVSCLEKRSLPGGPAPAAVEQAIQQSRETLKLLS